MLADVQRLVRRAITSGAAEPQLVPLLVGGGDPGLRFAVHQRHYEASLVAALLDTFPATVWLVGSTFVTEAARRFVRLHPPEQPCIAEYGERFPAFLSTYDEAARVPYLRPFAELEWQVGQVALAIDAAPLRPQNLSMIDGDALASIRCAIQPGVRYLQAAWAIDELLQLYLTDAEREQFELTQLELRFELRGARGEFGINRLGAGTFVFRQQIQNGAIVGEAADAALDADAAFDPGAALMSLIAEGLVTAIRPEGEVA